MSNIIVTMRHFIEIVIRCLFFAKNKSAKIIKTIMYANGEIKQYV